MTPASGSALGEGAEFDRIREIVKLLGNRAGSIGDDCVVVPDGSGTLVLSSDLSVERIHFRTDWLTWREIGWRATAGALSDLAAAGAAATGVLVSLGSPPEAPGESAVEVMGGVGDAIAAVGGVVLGGDLSRATEWVINVTVAGRAARPMMRSGAHPGDQLWVSGQLGGARAALSSWLAGVEPSAGARQAFTHPLPRIALGRRLAAGGATAMIDLSDGLGGDAGHLAAASGCRLEVDLASLPVHAEVAAQAEREGIAPPIFAGQGGEDYELLAALPPSFSDQAAGRLAQDTGVALTRIGRVVAGHGVSFRLHGEEVPLRGYDHFA
jgi:thiamine-monophosphate kinase